MNFQCFWQELLNQNILNQKETNSAGTRLQAVVQKMDRIQHDPKVIICIVLMFSIVAIFVSSALVSTRGVMVSYYTWGGPSTLRLNLNHPKP